jgi:hypothetical protein
VNFKRVWNQWRDKGFVYWFFKKLFHIPKPKYFLWDDLDDHGKGEVTWEQWEERAKVEHPIRFFLSETLPLWWRVHISMNIEHAWYWFRCHLWNRYHKLSLRQPHTGTADDYDWGWIDEDKQMLFAMFNILVDYVDLVNESEYHYGTTDEKLDALRKQIVEDEDGAVCLQNQLNNLLEAKALYEYWTITRKDQHRERDALLHDWYEHRREDKIKGDTTRWDKLQEVEEVFYKMEEEMTIRLMKIRRSLWT